MNKDVCNSHKVRRACASEGKEMNSLIQPPLILDPSFDPSFQSLAFPPFILYLPLLEAP